MRVSKKIVLVAATAVLALSGSMVFAQDLQNQQPAQIDLSDSELREFIEAYVEIQGVQNETNGEIQTMISKSDLSQEEFEQIQQALSKGDQEQLNSVSDSKKQEFSQVMESINTVQQEGQTDMVSIIEASNMDIDEFNNIIAGIQQDPSLYNRFEQMFQEMYN